MAPRYTATPRIRGKRLQRIRAAYLAAHPLCANCQRMGRIEPAVEVDHIVPLYRGGADAHHNRQGLCVECHKAKTLDDLAQRRPRGCDADGYPLDPDHRWHRAGQPTDAGPAVGRPPAADAADRSPDAVRTPPFGRPSATVGGGSKVHGVGENPTALPALAFPPNPSWGSVSAH